MTIPEEVRQLAQQGLEIQAVKRLCELTGMDLGAAKMLVDGLAKEGGLVSPPGLAKRWRVYSVVNYGNMALAGFLLGGIFALFSGYEIIMASRTLGWSRTEGTVVRSSVPEPGAASANVLYEYSVAGIQYRGDRIAYGKVVTELSARRLVGRYSEGKRVTVYYDPDSPSYSVLEQEASLGIHVVLALGIAGIGVGFWARRKSVEEAGADARRRQGTTG